MKIHYDNETLMEHLIHKEKELEGKIKKYQTNVIMRFPFIFLGLSTFGGVMIFYGFEKIIDQTPFLSDRPVAILISGFIILILTGALYRKLS